MRSLIAKSLLTLGACMLALLGADPGPLASAQEVSEPGEPSGAERWIVRIDPDAQVPDSTVEGQMFSASAEELLPGVFVVDAALGSALAGLPGVDAHPESEFRVTATPNDPCFAGCFPFGSQWHHQTINSEPAWDVATGTGSYTVAVLDSGINDGHLDLGGVVQRVSGCGLPHATAGSLNHGTFVAALVAASTNNGFGVSGVAWNANVLDVRVLTGGSGSEADVITGVVCAADLGVDVINLSVVQCAPFSTPCVPAPSQAFQDAIDYARSKGAAVVASAGNSGGSAAQYPAAYDGVIGVVATDLSASIAGFSDRGLWADVAAPGASIVSLSGSSATGITSGDGTSYAAPLVSGGAALVAQQFPAMDNDQIVRRLVWTSHPYNSPGSSEFGELDLLRALTQPVQSEWMVTDTGSVIALGDAPHRGDMSGTALNKPIVGMASTPSGNGYWLVASDGGIFSFGDAGFFGSTGNIALNQPIVGMASTPSGNGYWLVASDGGIFTFGDAGFFGSTGNIVLNQPIVGMAPTPSGNGYWLVASDGGIFTFGDAGFFGSTGNIALNQPIVGMASTPSGNGYWLVASDGGIFTFGDAPYLGSTGNIALNQPIVAMVSGPTGYRLVASDGGAFGFAASYLGSGANRPHSGQVVDGAGFHQ